MDAIQKPIIAVHGMASNNESLKNFVDAILRFMAPRGVNTAVIEIDYCFRMKCFPELCEGSIDPAYLREEFDALRRAGVEPVPLFNMFGHQGWSSRNSLLRLHPELDETPWLKDGVDFRGGDFEWYPPVDEQGRWTYAYNPTVCLSRENAYDYFFPIVDELIEITGCKTFHVGMDEVYLIGQCDRCRGIPRHELFGRAVNKIHDHLAGKGVRMMMWGDRLINARRFEPTWLGEPGSHTHGDFDDLGTAYCVDDVPKDILMVAWHYGHCDYGFAEDLLDHGHTVLPACWDIPENAAYLWENSLKAAKKPGCPGKLAGMVLCCWSDINQICKTFTDPDSVTDEHAKYFPRVLDVLVNACGAGNTEDK